MAEPTSEESPIASTPEDRLKEREAFATIAEAMERLGTDARMRVFRLLVTHFDLPQGIFRTPSVSPTSSSGPSARTSFSEDRSLSPKQFMLEKKPTTDIERIACLAYYLAHYRDTPHFKTLDLSKLNTEAAQIKLANPSKSSDNAVARNMLVQVGGGKRQLSALGELYVQALPDRDAARAAVAHARPRRKKARVTEIESDIDKE